jgi:hypothetical protein
VGYSRDDAWLGHGATRVDITVLERKQRNKKKKGFLSEDYLVELKKDFENIQINKVATKNSCPYIHFSVFVALRLGL